MSTINNTLPRIIIRKSLQGLRLPLSALELVTNKSGAASWPPAVAYESFEAEIRRSWDHSLEMTTSSVRARVRAEDR